VIIIGSGNRKGDERHKKLRDTWKEYINSRPKKKQRQYNEHEGALSRKPSVLFK
jgi:hypothetical protein